MFPPQTRYLPTNLEEAIVLSPIVVSPTTTVKEAIAHMSGLRSVCNAGRTSIEQHTFLHLEARSSCVVAVDSHERVIGILTERDVVRLSAMQLSLDQLPIAQVMTDAVITLRRSEFTDLLQAINLLQQHQIRHLPLIDNQDRLVGLVTHESLREMTRPIDLLRLRLVSEVMTQDLICATCDTSILDIAMLMANHRVSSVVIIQLSQTIQIAQGLLTERDLVQFQALDLSFQDTLAQEVMSTPAFEVAPDDSLWRVHQLMEQHWIRRVVVTGKQKELLGIVTQSNLLQIFNPVELYKLAEALEEEVMRLEAERISLLEIRAAELEQQVGDRTQAIIKQSARDKLVADLSIQIRSSLSLQVILDTTVIEVRQLLKCDRANIWQLKPDGQTTVVAESTNSAISLLNQTIHDHCLSEYQTLYRQGRIRVAPDIHTTPMSKCHREMLIRFHIRAKILIPLLCGDELWGWMNVTESQAPRNWTDDEVELLQALSIQLAIALGQSKLYEQLQQELKEKQQTENQLRASEQHYVTLAAIVPVGIVRADLQGNCTYVNERWCQITGLTMESTTGDGWKQGLHPDEYQKVTAEWDQAIREHRSASMEFRYQVQDGHIIWVYGQFLPELDANGEIIGYVGTLTDITERKQIELKLQATNARYESVIDSIGEGIWEWDYLQDQVFFSPRYLEILGYSPDSQIPLNYQEFLQIIHPEDVHLVEQAVLAHLTQHIPFLVECRALHNQTLNYIWVRSRGQATWDQTGRPIRMIGSIEDISDRKQSEILIRQSEQKYISLAESAPVGIFRTDTLGRCTYVNERWCQIAGLTADTSSGLGWEQALHPDDYEWVVAQWYQTVNSQLPFCAECRFLKADGIVTWVYSQAVAEYDLNGQIIGYIGTLTDISDRKQAEDELKHNKQRLQEAQRLAKLGNWELDLKTNSLYWSDEVFNIFEIDPSKFTASYETFLDTIHPGDLDMVTAAYTEHLLDRTPYNIVHRLLMSDGRIKYVQGQCETIYDRDGIALISQGTVQDITIQRSAELEQERIEKALRQIVEGTSSVTCENFFPKLVSHIAQALDIDYVIVSKLVGHELHSLGFWSHGELQSSISYLIANTPCEYVLRDGTFYCETDIQTLFPTDLDLIAFQVNSYLGIALKDDQGNAIGKLCILDSKPISTDKQAEILPILQIFASRASAELQRQIINDQLIQLNHELEARVAQRTAQLQERETRYRALMDNASDAILVADLHGYLLEVNCKTEELFGYSREQLTQMHQSQLHPPEDFELVTTAFIQVTQGQRTQMLDTQILRQDGKKVPVDISATIIQIEDQTIIQGIFRDISDRKQSENALRQSQQFLQTILDTFPLGVFWKNRQSLMLGCNELFAKTSGLASPLEVVGKTNFDFSFTEAEASGYLADDQQVIQSGMAKLGIEETMTLPTGEQRWVETNKIPLKDLEGNIVGIVGTFQDITERKAAQLALQNKTAELDRFFSLTLELLCIANTDGYFIRLNKQWENVLGYSVEELEGKLFLDYVHPDDLESTKEAITYLKTNSRLPGFVNRYHCRDGSYRWLNWHAASTGNLIYAAARDITNQILAEQENRQQAEREALLREVTQRIRQSLDLQTIFDTACQEIRQVLRTDRVGIFKFYPESGYDDGEFVAESVLNGFPSVVEIRVHDHCFGQNYSTLYAQGRYYVVDDIYHNGLTICHTNILSQFHVKANMVMPLLCGNQLWGLLCIHQCSSTRQWKTEEIELSHKIANQLAIAIQQAILYEQVQLELQVRQTAQAKIAQQLRQQQTLGAIIQQIRQSLDINDILTTVTQQVKDILQGDRVIVFRLIADGSSQIVAEAVSNELPVLKHLNWNDETWSDDILNFYWQGQPRIVEDVMDDIYTHRLIDYSIQGQIKSKIVAPILQEVRDSQQNRWVSPTEPNKLWGILVIHACYQQRIWTESEAQLLQQIANQLAIAIQQANLFDQLQTELTCREQAQQQLTERNEELLRATRLKDQFLANMSHELRTPLNAILGMTEGLQDKVFGDINSEQLKALQTIERSGSHLLELINDILELAKIESGQFELYCRPTAIATMCQSSLVFIKQQALKKRIQLNTQIPINLPELLIDERRIRQVLINLLNNAVKFTPEGGSITLAASVITHQSNNESPNYLRLSVTDTGIGIAPENIQKLFQPFIQIDSALNRQYQGTGLGLALVKRIVSLHGGQVGLTSEIGVGSCFIIDLPYITSTAMTNVSESNWTPLTLDQSIKSSALILLAEDNEASISTISSYLRAKGYRLLLARNGIEAVNLAKSAIPDLILMDIQMPQVDGLTAIAEIRQAPNLVKVPIIALTALAMDKDRELCLAAGANEYLSKPVKLKQLVTKIQQLLLG